MARDRLRFVHQLPSEYCRVIAIKHAGDRVSSRREFFQMFAVETPRFGIRIEEARFLVIDAKLIAVVGCVVDSGPAQVLRHTACVAPPVRQTQLHVDVVLRGFSNYFVEINECIFVPLSRREPEIVMAWPVFEVGHRLHVVWTTLAEGPNAHDFDASLRGLPQSFRHAFTICVAIHDCDIRAHKPKWLLTNSKPSGSLADKLILWSAIRSVWRGH